MKLQTLLPIAILLGAPLLAQPLPAADREFVGAFAVRTIEITESQPLSFGSIAVPPGGGAITVSFDGVRTLTGVVPLGPAGFGPSSLVVTMSGAGNPNYMITLPNSATLTGPGGATMTVDTFRADPGAGMVDRRTDQEVLRIGATLRVNPMQAPGSYSGVYPVTVHVGN